MAYIIPSSDSTAVNAPSYLMSEIPSESTITTLRSLARHYVDISELCILALHVEVRMHCFHHLLAIAHGPHTDYHGIIDKMEPDENVTRLNKDLAAIDDVMQQTLQHRKFRSALITCCHSYICITCQMISACLSPIGHRDNISQ